MAAIRQAVDTLGFDLPQLLEDVNALIATVYLNPAIAPRGELARLRSEKRLLKAAIELLDESEVCALTD